MLSKEDQQKVVEIFEVIYFDDWRVIDLMIDLMIDMLAQNGGLRLQDVIVSLFNLLSGVNRTDSQEMWYFRYRHDEQSGRQCAYYDPARCAFVKSSRFLINSYKISLFLCF